MTKPLVQSEQRPTIGGSTSTTMRVFVASTSEKIGAANLAAEALDSSRLEVKMWNRDFDFSASYMESLEKELERSDFAVVILTADDTANVRRKKVNLPRDNSSLSWACSSEGWDASVASS